MGWFKYEYDRNVKYGPASEENVKAYNEALAKGCPYFLYPYHGYQLRMTVRQEPDTVKNSPAVQSKER